MIVLKSPDEINKIRKSSMVVAEVLNLVSEKLIPGVVTGDLDRLAEEYILKRGAKPAFKGYRGFKHTLCISVNEEVVHGIPGKRELKDGDIVGVDCGVLLDDFYGDAARTYPIGNVSDSAAKLMDVGEKALMSGIEAALVDRRLYDISASIQETTEAAGFSVVRDLVGHGIGRNLHEEPQVPNYGQRGTGLKLRPGLVIAIETMINEGDWQIGILEDGWTVTTKDKKLSAHFEHTIAVTENGPEVLSLVS